MDNISFLDDKNDNKKKSVKEEASVPKWSLPENGSEAAEKKGGFFSFFKKGKAGIRESREEVLRAIGEQEPKDDPAPKKSQAAQAPNLMEPGLGETGIDASRIGIFNRLMDWMSRRKKRREAVQDAGQEIRAESADGGSSEGTEAQPEEKTEKKTKKPKDEKTLESSAVLETNLLEGESISFFDWQAKGTMLGIALLLSLAVLGLAYGGLYYWEKTEQAKIKSIEAKLGNVNTEIARVKEETKQYSALENKIRLVSVLLAKHVYWTNFFKFLEDNTIGDVYYLGFSGDNKGKYTIASRARSFNSLTEQLRVLKAREEVVSANITGGKVSTEKDDSVAVSFSLDIILDTKLFNKP